MSNRIVMKKKLILFALAFFFYNTYAQNGGVGINTTNPTATLHVVGNLKFIPDPDIEITRLVGITALGNLTEVQLAEEFHIVDGEIGLTVLDTTDDNIFYVGDIDQSATANENSAYHNYNLALNEENDDNTVIRISGETSGYTVTGFDQGYEGRIFYLYNAQNNNVTFTNLDANSLSQNQILTGSGANVGISGEGVAEFIYDSFLQKWILINIRS